MRLVGVGDNVVDKYRELATYFPGGQALNVAVQARRAGLPAAYLGVLGDDEAGRHVLAAITAEGLDLSHLRIGHGPNAYAEVALNDGNREFVGGDAGVSKFRLTPDDLAWLRGFDLIHCSESSYLEDQLPLLAAAGPLSFDFSVRDMAYVEPLLPHVTIAEFSLSDLDDAATDAFLARIHDLGPRLVLATRGSAPAVLYDGRGFIRQPTLPTELVDSLGAGDSFTARFLVGVIRKEDPAESLAAAALAAAATCSHYGAFGYGHPFVPNESDLDVASAAPLTELG